MKLLTPCCQHIQEYNPRSPVKWQKKRVTACKKCGKQFVIKKALVIKVETKKNKEEPEEKTLLEKRKINSTKNKNKNKFIDDPDELLYSVAIRELNKTNPDPRWASILLQTRKELGKREGEVLEQLQKLTTTELISILRKQSGKSSLSG